jgi:hypothetical protein
MSTIRATYVQHGSSAVPNITLNASGQVIVASGIVSSGTFAAPTGSAAAPGVYFVGDTNTGLYSPGADQVAVVTNGTGRLFVDASGNITIGTSNNNVLDQIASARPLVVQSSSSSTTVNGSSNSITICNSDTTTSNTSQLNFAAITGGSTLQYSSAVISAIHGARVNGQYPTGTLVFSTSTATNSAPTEKLRITSAGLVGIGTSAPGDLVTISDSTTPKLGLRTGTTQRGEFRATSAITSLVSYNSSPLSFIINDGTDKTAIYIDSSQRVGIGTTTVSAKLHIAGATGGGVAGIWDTNAGGARVEYKDNGTRRGYLNWDTNSLSLAADSGNSIKFSTNAGATQHATIDSSGRLLVGTSSARDNFFNTTGTARLVQVEHIGTGTGGISVVRNSNADGGSSIVMAASAGTALGSNTLVSSTQDLGQISFQGADGTEFVLAAAITAQVDGTPGANDMPGRLLFSTTADGASSPTERMRISQNGSVMFGKTDTNQSAGLGAFFVTGNSTQLGLVLDTATTSFTPLTIYNLNATNNGFRFYVKQDGGIGNFQANNVNLSDRNAKKDISPAADTWDCIKEWEIVNYRYKDQPDDADLNLGVIAQQVAESCPEVITVFEEAKDDQPEKLGVKEQQMYWMAIKALQEAQTRIETLEAEVAALKGA